LRIENLLKAHSAPDPLANASQTGVRPGVVGDVAFGIVHLGLGEDNQA
jgi:hypothetical protein